MTKLTQQQKSRFSRKGMGMEYVVGLILFLVLLLLLLGYITNEFGLFMKGMDHEKCASTVRQTALLKKVSAMDFSELIQCKTDIMELDAQNVKESQERIGEALYYCSKNFLQGKRELFSGSGTYCHVCAHMTFDDKTAPSFSITDYLITEPAPGNPTQSIAEYIAGQDISLSGESYVHADQRQIHETYERRIQENQELVRSSAFASHMPQRLSEEINPTKDYAVVFRYARGQSFVRTVIEDLGLPRTVATGLIGGGAMGAIAASTTIIALSSLIIVAAPVSISALLATGVVTKAALGAVGVAGVVGSVGGVAGAARVAQGAHDDVEWVSSTQLVEWDKEHYEELGCEYHAAGQQE